MKKPIMFNTLLLAVLLVGLGLASCQSSKTEQGQGREAAAKDSIAFSCPMHPDVTGKEGDVCPKCGMKLEAMKKADSTAGHPQ